MKQINDRTSWLMSQHRTLVWAATVEILKTKFFVRAAVCLFPRKHLTFQNLQEHLERLLAEENGSEDSRGRRYCLSNLCFLLVLLHWEGQVVS